MPQVIRAIDLIFQRMWTAQILSRISGGLNGFPCSASTLHHRVVTADVVRTAERLVGERFPHARAAWLGGSAATGSMTDTSDLDITVLLRSGSVPFRESLIVAGRPVELFVHTEDSLELFRAQDLRRRRPTMLRLIGSSIVLVDTDGAGQRLREQFDRLDRQGPPALTPEELDTARYAVTDLLDDLTAGGAEALSIAAALWNGSAQLVLGAHGRWSGTGKWLLRELRAMDAERDTDHAQALLAGLAATVGGDTTRMQAAVEAVLITVGGRLFDGYRRAGTTPEVRPLNQPRLEADGVVLRTFADSDIDVIIDAGRDPLIPLISTVSADGDRADALKYVRNQHSRAADGTGWSYAITNATTGTAVGQIGLWRNNIEHGRASIGYWVAPSHRRRGYASSALKALTAWAATLPEINRLELYVEPFNEASWRAADSAGYQREGLLHRWQVLAGQPRDMYMYAKMP